MSHPRDPRQRRQGFAPPVDALAAAVRLEMGADAMRAALAVTGPEADDLIELATELGGHDVDPVDRLAADVVTAVQLGTVEPPLTAQEFADAIGPVNPHGSSPWVQDESWSVGESSAPAPVVAVPPTPPAPVEAFSSERSPGWRSRHDPASLAFSADRQFRGQAPLQELTLPTGPVLDQGAATSCVGFAMVAAWTAMDSRAAAALTVDRLAEEGKALYDRAQRLDDIPGEGYPGTSILAGMKAGVERGWFGGYLWAFGTRPIAQTILQRRRPVVVGVGWHPAMWETGPGGLVTVPGGRLPEGHALAVVGIRRTGPQGQPGPFFVWQNSGGTGYGAGGFGYVHHRDLARLLHGAGEAAIPTDEAQAPA